MKVVLESQIFLSYQRLSYKVWYALAEFVDNSTQAYFNNEKLLKKIFTQTGEKLTVSIEVGATFIRITDNSIGMSKQELQRAVTVGKPPKIISGRSKYGLGLKTGASWLGNLWTVTTKKYNDPAEYTITFNVPRVASGDLDLRLKKRTVDRDKHYTIIEIQKLHTPILGNTIGKVKNFLRSIYRVDLRTENLILKWGDEILRWDQDKEVDNQLKKNKNGKPAKRDFNFSFGKHKKVRGWAGVLDPGGRNDAGFSIIQSNRVIKGWLNSWRPALIFGEGGRNDLINQRLVGEIHLEGFDVSHTKDEILFGQGEEERLAKKLKGEIGDLIKLAREYRAEPTPPKIAGTTSAALNHFEKEIKSDKIRDVIENYELPNMQVWMKSNIALMKSLTKRNEPKLTAKIGAVEVLLYFIDDMSPNDPYVLYESTSSKKSVIVLLNMSHPHWQELTKEESILNFIRHCTYDGVAEWKTFFKVGKIEPDTVKLLKDQLLRSTFEMAD